MRNAEIIRKTKETDIYLKLELDGKGTYVRSDESHVQRAYSVEQICRMLKDTGFSVEVYDEKLAPITTKKDQMNRVFFLARK